MPVKRSTNNPGLPVLMTFAGNWRHCSTVPRTGIVPACASQVPIACLQVRGKARGTGTLGDALESSPVPRRIAITDPSILFA